MLINKSTRNNIKLFERSCSNTNGNVTTSYDDSGLDLVCNIAANGSSFQALAALRRNPQGQLTFRIRDAYETDTGMLNSASINICNEKLYFGCTRF
jgi:hypothetical protein